MEEGCIVVSCRVCVVVWSCGVVAVSYECNQEEDGGVGLLVVEWIVQE